VTFLHSRVPATNSKRSFMTPMPSSTSSTHFQLDVSCPSGHNIVSQLRLVDNAEPDHPGRSLNDRVVPFFDENAKLSRVLTERGMEDSAIPSIMNMSSISRSRVVIIPGPRQRARRRTSVLDEFYRVAFRPWML